MEIFLASKNIPVVSSPDFFLFSRLKIILKGHSSEDVNKTICDTTEEIKTISSDKFQTCFKKWHDRWEHYIEAKSYRSLF